MLLGSAHLSTHSKYVKVHEQFQAQESTGDPQERKKRTREATVSQRAVGCSGRCPLSSLSEELFRRRRRCFVTVHSKMELALNIVVCEDSNPEWLPSAQRYTNSFINDDCLWRLWRLWRYSTAPVEIRIHLLNLDRNRV